MMLFIRSVDPLVRGCHTVEYWRVILIIFVKMA
jgi:hypothetical protein